MPESSPRRDWDEADMLLNWNLFGATVKCLVQKNLAHEIIQIKEISMNEYHFDDPYYPPRTIVYQVWWSKALLRTKDWGPRAKSTLYVLICPIPHVVVSLPHFVFVRLHDFTKCVCVCVCGDMWLKGSCWCNCCRNAHNAFPSLQANHLKHILTQSICA